MSTLIVSNLTILIHRDGLNGHNTQMRPAISLKFCVWLLSIYLEHQSHGKLEQSMLEQSMNWSEGVGRGFFYFVQFLYMHSFISKVVLIFMKKGALCLEICIWLRVVQGLVQIVTNDFKTELREENHWLLFAPIPVETNSWNDVLRHTHNETALLRQELVQTNWYASAACAGSFISSHRIEATMVKGARKNAKHRLHFGSRSLYPFGYPYVATMRLSSIACPVLVKADCGGHCNTAHVGNVQY